MLALLTIAVLSADPAPKIPANVRLYFETADSAKTKFIVQLEDEIKTLTVKLNGEPNLVKKGLIRLQIQNVEKQIAKAKKTTPFAFIPNSPPKGQIGLLKHGEITAIVDEDTAIINMLDVAQGNRNIIVKTPTKKLKLRQAFKSDGFWEVESVREGDDALKAALKAADSNYTLFPWFTVVPVDGKKIAELRTVYDAEKNP